MREFVNGVTYNQLITFKAIVEAGNISKASKHLGISSASVSSSLKTLEQQLGQTLFTRTTRAIKLTDIGNQLYCSTHFAIDELAKSVEVVYDLNNSPCGTLSLNIATTIYHWFVKDLLVNFQRTYPAIQLDITLSDTLDQHVEQQFDIGFRYGERVEESMITKPFHPSKQGNSHIFKAALFASQRYIELQGLPTSISQLSSHAMVKLRMPTSKKLAPLRLHKQPTNSSEIVNIDTNTAMVVNDMTALVDMVRQDFGIGMMIDFVLDEQFENGSLVPILRDHWCNIPNIYMHYAKESKQSQKVRCFLEFIEQQSFQPFKNNHQVE
ncbi:LysR family transcriptional regulator [Endozoicomonas sp. G2_1]|uniref:LysR family transcriptional regulator n=1 Tax=Endozoicomonas sp. G2_1 TaxID=2821091 RepID=UPI001ADA41B4|nr:LysR family transcriptional regulator [Endozoicomonas sp. G2_1]MBO9491632.1 LysR family transcriptional regulator [Endozoicomonas sp. G2_1]